MTVNPPTRLGAPLTQRETQVCNLVMQGLSNREIGAQLHITIATVKTHLEQAMSKLGVGRHRTLLALCWAGRRSDVAAQRAREAVAEAAGRGRLQLPKVWNHAAVYSLLKQCSVAGNDVRGEEVTGVPDALIEHFGTDSPELKPVIRMMCHGLEDLGLLRWEAGLLIISRLPNYAEACRDIAGRGGCDVSSVVHALRNQLDDFVHFQVLCDAA